MGIPEIVSLIGGIALFLFGMSLMGDNLKRLSGQKLEPILYRLSGTTIKGVLLGTGVTAVIQSSSATAVMTVGFVNSGMMKVRQGISVILGAILGTSITGWIICLGYVQGGGGVAQIISSATLTGIVAAVGIVIRMVTKKKTSRYIADIMMGFAILMFGMSAMSGAVSGLGNEEWFRNSLTSMRNPFLGILVGALFTALLQSASATVGIIQALSVTGAMSFEVALPILMGITFGASVPVLFSAIGANTGGKRTAWVYPIVTVMGAAGCACLYYVLNAIFHFPFTERVMNPFSIAIVNTLLRLVMIMMLTPMANLVEKMVNVLIKEKQSDKKAPGIRLEERFIAYPALAIEQSGKTINDMAGVSEKALLTALNLFSEYSEEGFDEVREMENDVDGYEDSLGTYLIKLTGRELTAGQSGEISKYLHTISDFERISDHALNLAGSAKELFEKKESFSEEGQKEIDTLFSAVTQVVNMTVKAFCENNLELAAKVEPLEEVIDELSDRMKLNHVERLQRAECSIPLGFVFNDIIINCERVSDHCSNIAIALIELSEKSYQTHEYLHTLKREETEEFRESYEEFEEKYFN